MAFSRNLRNVYHDSSLVTEQDSVGCKVYVLEGQTKDMNAVDLPLVANSRVDGSIGASLLSEFHQRSGGPNASFP